MLTGVVALVLIVAILLIGFTATGNQFVANQIASRVSTPDMQVSIDGARGLLSGNFRIDRVGLADTKGQFAELKDIQIDWSPLDLLGAEFHAQRIAASNINVDRAPVTTIEPEPSEGSFRLPVEISIDAIDLPAVALGKPLIGRAAELMLKGSAHAATDTIALKLDASQKDRPDAIANADLAYAVNNKTLKLDLKIAEPKGGLLATLLKLPDNPAVDIAVTGDGPLADWAGVIRAKLDGVDRLAVNARHQQSQAGVHNVKLDGGGAIGDLMPPALRTLFEGESKIDVDASFDAAGLVDVRSGTLANSSLSLNVAGKLDPKGDANLNGSLQSVSDVITLRWPLQNSELQADIRNAAFVASGPFNAVNLNLSTDLASVALPQGRFDNVFLRLTSDALDLAKRSGRIDVALTAKGTAPTDPQLARLIRAPLGISSSLDITPTSLATDNIEISSGAIGGAATLRYALDTKAIASDFKLYLLPASVLPDNLAPKIDGMINIGGNISGTPDELAFNKLRLTTNLVSAEVSGTLKAGQLAASLTGDMLDIAALQPNVSGKAHITADISGPLNALTAKAQVTSAELTASDRTLQNIDVKFDGLLDPAKTGGKLTANASFNGKPIDLTADIVRQNGLISLPALSAHIGQNSLTGVIDLGADFLPTGKINLDLPDLASLAKLAGQTAEGDLKATIELASKDGALGAKIDGTGTRIAASNVVIADPVIHVESANLLADQLSGTIKSREIASGANRLAAIEATFSRKGTTTDFGLNSQFDSAPLTAKGTVDQQADGLGITLAEFSATPARIPLSLSTPANLKVINGTVSIEGLTISAGTGTIAVSGTAGQVLDLTADVSALPANLANTFVPDLAADGTISAQATVKGIASAPTIAFDVTSQGLIARQMRDAGLTPINVVAKGTFANSLLSLDTTIEGIEKLGKTNLIAEIAVASERITARKLDIKGERLNGTLAADYVLNTKSVNATFDLSVLADGLAPPDIAAKIKGPIGITGKLAGNLPDNLSVSDLKLSSNVLTAQGTTTLKGKDLQAKLTGDILDIAAFHPDASGKAQFTADLTGPLAALNVKAALTAQQAVLAGRALKNLDVKIDGIADPAKPSGKVTATGSLDGQVIDVAADLVTDQGHISVPAIKANIGENTVKGAIQLAENYLPTGNLTFDFPDIGLLAALGGQKAEGDISGQVDLSSKDGKIGAKIKANGTGILAQGLTIRNPAVDLDIPDLMAGQVSGTAKAGELISGQNRLAKLDARFSLVGNKTDFDIKGNYDGAPLTAKGSVQNAAEGLSVSLENFAASPKKIPVRLSSPVTIRMINGSADIANLTIVTGKGAITVNGTAGEKLDLKIKVTALPASLANTFAAGLDASGTISANATVAGTSSDPAVNFDVNWQNAATSQIRAAGLSAFTIMAKGKLAKSVLSIDTTASNNGGLSLRANGTVGTTGAQQLNLSVKGKMPFAAIASQLAAQGLALKGNADFDISIRGTAASPSISGRINTSGSQFIAIRQNLIVNKLAATITLSGQTATVSSLTGSLEGGGKISASGTVGIAPGSGFPANLTVKLDDAVYADGRVVVAKLAGDLNLKGPLQTSPTLGGTIRIRRADITVPERLPASLANVNVKHKNAPRAVTAQTKEIRADADASTEKSKSSGITLSLKIVAPRQIFVRGRGLDAELGGQVLVSGSSNAPNVSGGFKMLRGRLSIIGKRLDFTTGIISFGGGMVPALNMVASTVVNATTLNVTVSGLANDPAFAFSSSPALPQDEVLAQLIFGRNSSSLSPFQIAQLADAVATLSGGQPTSLFNKLRQGLGVDDLNVGTDENGGAQVTAGKYLNRRTYLELKQGENESNSGAAINLDIGKGVKLRGEANSDGNTSTGIFFEKEY